jgi:hypothetical protein
MLVVHPSSCCDICLDPYSSSDIDTSPHAIECGHIFCLGCLYSFDTSRCPLCREPFDINRVKKLHVEDSHEEDSAELVDFLLRRMTLVSGEGVPEVDDSDVEGEEVEEEEEEEEEEVDGMRR